MRRQPETNFITFDVGEDEDSWPIFSFWKPTRMTEERYAAVAPEQVATYLQAMQERLLTLDPARTHE